MTQLKPPHTCIVTGSHPAPPCPDCPGCVAEGIGQVPKNADLEKMMRESLVRRQEEEREKEAARFREDRVGVCRVCGGKVVGRIERGYPPNPRIGGPPQSFPIHHGWHCETCGLKYEFPTQRMEEKVETTKELKLEDLSRIESLVSAHQAELKRPGTVDLFSTGAPLIECLNEFGGEHAVILELIAQVRAVGTSLLTVTDDAERLRVQLAGCAVAACGGTSDEQVAKPDDYGWSDSYSHVLRLRTRFDQLLAERDELEQALQFAADMVEKARLLHRSLPSPDSSFNHSLRAYDADPKAQIVKKLQADRA